MKNLLLGITLLASFSAIASNVVKINSSSSFIVSLNEDGAMIESKPVPKCINSISGYSVDATDFGVNTCDITYAILDEDNNVHIQMHRLLFQYDIPKKEKVKFEGFDITWTFTGGAIGNKPFSSYTIYQKDAAKLAEIDLTKKCYIQAKKLLNTMCSENAEEVYRNQLFNKTIEENITQSAELILRDAGLSPVN